ncbi:MAG: EamA family transporter [Methanolinea sp.]|nr:EamA family transporter [Methanolinea sp.]
MAWFLLALAGALAQAAYSAGAKSLLARFHPARLAGGTFLAAALALAAISLVRGIPPVAPGFPAAVLATVAINAAATVLFYRALSISDLSLCLPMLSFTPVFLVFTAFAILGETPSPAGSAGICLVVAGSYLLGVHGTGSPGRAWTAPFRVLSSDRGVRYMLLVAFLYSISVNYDRLVVAYSDPVFGSAAVYGSLACIFVAWEIARAIAGRGRGTPRATRRGVRECGALLLLGMVLVVEAVAVNTAYTLSLVPYVIAVKRLSVLFGVLAGGFLLGEESLVQRGAGAAVMVAGAVLIVLGG